MQGWIKLHRQLLDSHIFQNEKLLKIWIWCLMKATHKERMQIVGRQKVRLEEGQFVTGRNAAAAELGMAPSTAWDYLKLLESEECINIKSNNKFSVVTIVNWDFYQGEDEKSDSKDDSKKTTDGQQMDTNKNVKNEKNIYMQELEEEVFPHWLQMKHLIKHRKITQKMKTKYKSARKDYNKEQIMEAIKNYNDILGSEKHYFSYKWSLDEFLSRGLNKFEVREVAWDNFLESKYRNAKSSSGDQAKESELIRSSASIIDYLFEEED